jgi:hypothetical protein
MLRGTTELSLWADGRCLYKLKLVAATYPSFDSPNCNTPYCTQLQYTQLLYSKATMLSSSNAMRTGILRSGRLATQRTALLARSATAQIQTTRRNFSSSQRTLCASCATSGGQSCARHNPNSRASAGNITTSFSPNSSLGKTAAYATAASPVIPNEQWAQVLEERGGGKLKSTMGWTRDSDANSCSI